MRSISGFFTRSARVVHGPGPLGCLLQAFDQLSQKVGATEFAETRSQITRKHLPRGIHSRIPTRLGPGLVTACALVGKSPLNSARSK